MLIDSSSYGLIRKVFKKRKQRIITSHELEILGLPWKSSLLQIPLEKKNYVLFLLYSILELCIIIVCYFNYLILNMM